MVPAFPISPDLSIKHTPIFRSPGRIGAYPSGVSCHTSWDILVMHLDLVNYEKRFNRQCFRKFR